MRKRKQQLQAAEEQLARDRELQRALLQQSSQQRRTIAGHKAPDHRCQFAIERDKWKVRARQLTRRNKALMAELAEAHARIEELRVAAIASQNGATIPSETPWPPPQPR